MERITDRLLNWASVIEENTLEQARRTSTMPFIHPHLALMPDAHLGLGATVGSVIPTLGAVMPAAVGVAPRRSAVTPLRVAPEPAPWAQAAG